jgi:O-antigen/teichoic acid export membrane protein
LEGGGIDGVSPDDGRDSAHALDCTVADFSRGPAVNIESPVDPAASSPSLVGRFFRHGATYTLAAVLSQGIAFLLFPFFAHVFSPRDYGIIDLIGLVTNLVNLTVALEISQGLGRFFPEASDNDDRVRYASTALIFTVVMYTLTLGTSLAFVRPLTAVILGGGVHSSLMVVSIATMWCSGMLYLTQDILRWQLRPMAFAVVSVVTATVVTATSAIVVLGFGAGVVGAIAGQLTGFACAAALALYLSRDLFRLRFDRTKFRLMLAYSIPLIPSSIGVFLNVYVDRIAIRARLTVADVGLYGAAYRLSIITSLTLLGFQGALLPLVMSRHELPQTRRDIAHVFRLFCALALIVFVGVSLFADELLRVLTRPAFYGAARVVPLIVAASFFGGMYVFAPGPYIARRTHAVVVVNVVSGVANAVLAFLLARPLGIEGAALAFLIAAAAGFAALMVASQRAYRVPHDWRRILPAGVGVSVLVVVGRLFLAGSPSLLSVAAKVLLSLAACLLVSTLLVGRAELNGLVRAYRGLRLSNRARPLP